MNGLFDDDFPSGEQIPRQIEAHFTTYPTPFGPGVRLIVNGSRVGDPLTDNGWSETGYRWHDALHLAHAMCLGWSPVLRGLADLKRRSDPQVDHIEDGGRAVVADEAIAWAVFCRARRRDWFERRPVDSELIGFVQAMTYGLEVGRCSRAEIAHAIRTGVSCMRSLWWHHGGILLGDLRQRSLEWRPAANAPVSSRRQQ
ncbi:hypothetical protein Aple_060350 [Acrocarpospora pleiomorpha]|uniref:MazG C-terminal domain-containing protein n=1 Tax=Acrocarpospora pleiomorpha TaxID=90975 RepID=A0A5M3XQS3_9ACTN|nr:hypothetical protein [Acrocarpospora pleiomorpha]GES23136.1 hypothetical protein Aple_060350 [Acrocarpospora pleiomorpha]